MKKIQLPSEIREPKRINPKTMLIYAAPKVGKTTIVSKIEDSLLIELEPGGADSVSGMILDIKDPFFWDETNKKIVPYIDIVLNEIKESKKKYKYLIIDTLTQLDVWAEIYGTYIYMEKTMGKSFNREGGLANGKKIYHTNDKFETVHELPNGYGYQYSRKVLTELWFNRICDSAEHIIFIAHIKDKYIGHNDGTQIVTSEIDLTGKTKSIIASRVDSIAQLVVDKDKRYLNFEAGKAIEAGSRYKHLKGEILISEQDSDGEIKTYWDNIFIK